MKEKEEKEIIIHPSIGLLQICETTGHQRFPHTFTQNHYLSLAISRAEIHRDLTDDHFYDREELIRISITHQDFLKLFLNKGNSGIPCIINRDSQGGIIDLPKIIKSRPEVTRDFHFKRLDDLIKSTKTQKHELVKKLNNSPNINKNLKAELISYYDSILRELESNIPFIAEVMQEHMQDAAYEAEQKLNTAIKTILTNHGLLAIKNKDVTEIKKLLNENDRKEQE